MIPDAENDAWWGSAVCWRRGWWQLRRGQWLSSDARGESNIHFITDLPPFITYNFITCDHCDPLYNFLPVTPSPSPGDDPQLWPPGAAGGRGELRAAAVRYPGRAGHLHQGGELRGLDHGQPRPLIIHHTSYKPQDDLVPNCFPYQVMTTWSESDLYFEFVLSLR